jgi:hypothetical protein
MKKLNILLLKHIIKTDFFILENRKFRNLKILNLISNKNFSILDVIELNSSIKQFLRILQFVKKKSLSINILNFNRQYLTIFQNFFKKNFNKIKNKLNFKENSLQSLFIEKAKISELFIFFNIKSNFKKDFLISEINSVPSTIDMGKYKIFNNVNSFKKLITLLSLIYNTLQQFKINKN